MPLPVTVYVIAYNEAANLRALLPTVQWADEVLVLDSFSIDDTAQVCNEFGVRLENQEFEGFGKLRNRALELAKHDWIVSIDADERSTPEFAEAVAEIMVAPQHSAYLVPRRNYFLGKSIQHCGWYPDYRQPQILDRRKFHYVEDLVHEGYECTGSIGTIPQSILQYPYPTLAVALAKMDRYSSLMAKIKFEKQATVGWAGLLFLPALAFVKKFVLQQGFRDGVQGLMLSAIHAYYTFMKYAKLWEMQHGDGPASPHR